MPTVKSIHSERACSFFPEQKQMSRTRGLQCFGFLATIVELLLGSFLLCERDWKLLDSFVCSRGDQIDWKLSQHSDRWSCLTLQNFLNLQLIFLLVCQCASHAIKGAHFDADWFAWEFEGLQDLPVLRIWIREVLYLWVTLNLIQPTCYYFSFVVFLKFTTVIV